MGGATDQNAAYERMISIGAGTTKVYLATGATDLRRGFNGLYILIEHQLGRNPLSGDLYVFTNRRRDLIKIFFWEAGGMWVCAKRLESGTLRWPRAEEKTVPLTPAQLQLLLSGIDLTQTRVRERWDPAERS